MKKLSCIVICLSLIFSTISLYAFADESEVTDIPEPIKVVDFSNSFEGLSILDPEFEVVDNAAKPVLIEDEEMGQVLKLGKAVIKNQNTKIKELFSTGAYSEIRYIDMAPFIVTDDSEYSTINISNPYAGLEHLVEYEPYEDVETTMYRYHKQPLWKEGITISYWIKSPSSENGYGVNSNVLGFTSERFQIQADDYSKHLTTVKFDLEYNSLSDDERAELGANIERCGVLPDSEFYFELASDDLYENAPIYKSPLDESMGRVFWMNKFYVDGYYLSEDGEYKPATNESARYDYYSVAPELGETKDAHNPGSSNLRYGWTYGEMWLDASSSFYFTNDEPMEKQLNPNHEESYGDYMGMQENNTFNINSWRCFNGVYCSYEEADYYNDAAESPVIEPDKWHYVTVVIQNDWVKYYFDGKEIDIEKYYSSFGGKGIYLAMGYQPWKRFNKGTGARYGYGCNKTTTYWSYYHWYCSPTIMEWLTMDCVNLTIGGGNRYGDGYFMYADTDEICIKNIVFYDTMLTNEQIEFLADLPFYYQPENPLIITGDVNGDGNITAEDALKILKHSAKLETIENVILYDLTGNGTVDSEDALEILKTAAGLS